MRAVVATTLLAVIVGISNTQTIDPDSVSLSSRDAWCTNQKTSCPLICTQLNNGSEATEENSCDPDTLVFSCVCANGITPNASQYTQTIPFYECQEFGNQCVANCGHDNACSDACRTDNPCGAQDPPRVNSSTISTMAATSTDGQSAATGSAVFTGFGGGPAATTAHNAAPAALPPMALELGQAYGLGVVLTSLLAGFGLML